MVPEKECGQEVHAEVGSRQEDVQLEVRILFDLEPDIGNLRGVSRINIALETHIHIIYMGYMFNFHNFMSKNRRR